MFGALRESSGAAKDTMKLYDAYGREVDTARLREEQAAPTMAGCAIFIPRCIRRSD